MISLIELEARAAKCSLTSGLHAERADRNADHFLPAACTRRLCFLCLLSVFRLCCLLLHLRGQSVSEVSCLKELLAGRSLYGELAACTDR